MNAAETASMRPIGKDTHTRSLLKAISWRCVGTLDTFVVSFIVLTATGASGTAGHAARVSGSIAAVEVLTKIGLYYLHERAWHRIPLGRRRRDCASTV